MRLIDADKLYPDRMTTKGGVAISQSQIANAPTVESERKTGKWVHMVGWWECNQCHAEYTGMPTCMGEAIYDYCPMCGSRMVEPQESEDKE